MAILKFAFQFTFTSTTVWVPQTGCCEDLPGCLPYVKPWRNHKLILKASLVRLVLTASLLLVACSCTFEIPPPPDTSAPLKIGLLLNFTGSPEASADRERAFQLAIRHINAGGGVLGQPVTGITADATSDPQAAVEAARHLIEIEGVHAIVGPNASAAALPIAETVAGPAGIPVIGPSTTSPQLTTVPDNDYFFRTALSDAIQGPVLANVTWERGFDNVGLIYFNDAYGQGLAAAFAQGWQGKLQAVALEVNQTSYLPELRESAMGGAQALVVVAPENQALAVVRMALDEGLYDQFIFGDAAKRLRLVNEIGGAYLGGMYGTASASDPDNDASPDWEIAFLEAYGALPVLAYIKATYDATVAIALAAQAAGSVEGQSIRDQLRGIGGPPGQIVLGTPASVADGLRWLAAGREIDYEGAASTLDWDEHGDLREGYVGIWRFTQDEGIEEVDTVFVQN